jgi:hypothetical protein
MHGVLRKKGLTLVSSSYKIYLFEYFDRVYDSYYSAFTIMSAHQTKRGAYKALLKHKHDRWYDDRNRGRDPEFALECGVWKIREMVVLND